MAGPGELKSVSNMSVRSIPIEPMSRSSLDEFVALRDSMDMLGVMRETLECIVRYSTRPSDEEMDTREPAALTANLLKTARIIEAMRRLDEHDQVHCVDVKLVEGVLNLDYVVDEFRSYLRLARDEASKRLGTEEYCKCLDEMSGVVERVAVAIESTPVKLFTSKGLPPPRELNSTSVLGNYSYFYYLFYLNSLNIFLFLFSREFQKRKEKYLLICLWILFYFSNLFELEISTTKISSLSSSIGY